MNLKEFKKLLDEKVSIAEQVFIVPHIGVDFDAMASCLAMDLIIKKMEKGSYIIIDEDSLKVEPGVKVIIDEMRKNVNIITMDKYRQIKGNKDLLITLDVNKKHMVCCRNEFDNFSDIIIIDHHKEDENTINTDNRYIDITLSSVSEVMTELLCLYLIRYDKRMADYLLSGIYLDTNKLSKNVTSRTMRCVSKLMERGADLNKVNDLFVEDFVSDRKVQELVSKANFLTYTIAVCIADSDVNYTKEELAKVADYLLKYKVDAAFACGYIDDELLSISARSKGKIDVGEIMKELSGGGNVCSAATRISNEGIDEVSGKLVRKLVPSYYKGSFGNEDK